MKIEPNLGLDVKKIKKLTTIAGVVTAIIVLYYATGLYRNYLQIKKLKVENSKPLEVEDY